MAYHSIEQLRYPSEPLSRVIYGYACACGAQESFLVSETPRIAVVLELTESGHLRLVEYHCQGVNYLAPTTAVHETAHCFECGDNTLKLISMANLC